MILRTIEEIYIDTNAWNGKEPIYYVSLIINLSPRSNKETWEAFLINGINEIEKVNYKFGSLRGYHLIFRRSL